MPKYVVTSPDGQKYEVNAPEGATEEEAIAYVQNNMGEGQASSGEPTSPSPTRVAKGKIDPDSLQYDKEWLNASRTWYRSSYGKDFEGDDKALAEEGMSVMRWFDNNTAAMTFDASKLTNASPEQKQAFLYMLDTWDNTDWSWSGVGKSLGMQVVDPVNWASVASLGIGFGAKTAGKAVAKEGLKELLRKGMKVGAVAAIDNAIVGGGQEAIKQQARVNAGGQDSIDLGQVGEAAAISGITGGILGTGAGTALAKLDNVKAIKAADEAAQAVFDKPANVRVEITPDPKPKDMSTFLDEIAKGEPSRAADEAALSPSPVKEQPDLFDGPSSPSPIPVSNDADSIIQAIKNVSADSGARVFYRTREGLDEAVQGAATLIKNLGINSVRDATEVVRRYAFTQEQTQVLKASVQTAAERLLTELTNAKDAAPDVLDDLMEIQHVITQMDLALSSASGRDLGMRAGGLITGDLRDKSTIPDMLTELGLPDTPENRQVALDSLKQQVQSRTEAAAQSAEVKRLESVVSQKMSAGDIDGALDASKERDAILKMAEEQAIEQLPLGKKASRFVNNLLAGVATWVQSVLLGTDSLVRNVIPSVVKTLYKPSLNALMQGLSPAAKAEMRHTYYTMWRVQGEAIRHAVTYFRYGEDLLAHSPDKMLETKRTIPGRVGSVPIQDIVTFVPRVMGATDQYFRVLHYRAFIEGNAVKEATQQAAAKGMSETETQKFVGAYLADHVAKSYDNHIDSVTVIDMLREQGVRRGYTGDTLDHFIKTELAKNGDLFKQAANQTGIDYVNDLLFARSFSGDGAASRVAKLYQDHVHRQPLAKIFLNPYFLTPVRVFEEGVRLTPLVQFIAPKFISDLKGANGPIRQIRAYGELMMSQSLALTFMLKYSAGEITDGGPVDYRERRAWEAAGNKPYTIKIGGEEYSYRNLDPFSTPFKIMSNAMARYRVLDMKMAQGEYADATEIEKVGANLGVAVFAIQQALQDTGMIQGIADLIELLDTKNADKDSDAGLKFIMDKAKMLFPRMITKVRSQFDDEMNSPKTMEQYIQNIVNPASDTIPGQYDSLGMPRKSGLGWWSLMGVDIVNHDRGLTEGQKEINEALADISVRTGKTFELPRKHPFYGSADLRTVYTKDGSKTLYDRWAELYREMPLEEGLLPIVRAPVSTGTRSVDGIKPDLIGRVIKQFQNAAFAQMMSEETGIQQKYIDNEIRKSSVLVGEGDSAVSPY